MQIRVSVITPARNEEAYIAGAIASVAAQQYPRTSLECVVVDNGSSDGTSTVAREAAERHADLAVTILSEPQPGVSRAKNTGAAAAGGEILIFLDADSRLDVSLVEAVARTYSDGAPAGSIRIVADSADLLERGFFALLEVGKTLFGIRAQMLYCERSLFLQLGGFRPELHHAEDLEFLRRVRRHLDGNGGSDVAHVRSSFIATSPRRLKGGRMRGRMVSTFVRMLLANFGIGRERPY